MAGGADTWATSSGAASPSEATALGASAEARLEEVPSGSSIGFSDVLCIGLWRIGLDSPVKLLLRMTVESSCRLFITGVVHAESGSGSTLADLTCGEACDAEGLVPESSRAVAGTVRLGVPLAIR